jgi:hypothetical protein
MLAVWHLFAAKKEPVYFLQSEALPFLKAEHLNGGSSNEL